jgi:hypothetical protein
MQPLNARCGASADRRAVLLLSGLRGPFSSFSLWYLPVPVPIQTPSLLQPRLPVLSSRLLPCTGSPLLMCRSFQEMPLSRPFKAASGDAPTFARAARRERAFSVEHERVLSSSSQLPLYSLEAVLDDLPFELFRRNFKWSFRSPCLATFQRAISIWVCASTIAWIAFSDAVLPALFAMVGNLLFCICVFRLSAS